MAATDERKEKWQRRGLRRPAKACGVRPACLTHGIHSDLRRELTSRASPQAHSRSSAQRSRRQLGSSPWLSEGAP